MILVIGATAHFGRQTVEALVAGGHTVRALTRTPEKAGLPASVEVVRGDLDDPATLVPAVAGVRAIFLVLPYPLSAANLIEAAAAAGTGRIVFLSSGAIIDGAAPQPDAIAAYHASVEDAIRESGVPFTFLRLFFPAINSLTWAMQLQHGDVVRGPYAAASSAPVHERDVAAVAAAVLTEDGHEGEIHDLTGPEPLTQVEQVRILGDALGRPLSFEELDPAPVREQMSAFMDPAFVNALFDLMAATTGGPAAVSPAVERITGRAPRGYREWAEDHRADF
ncbi:NmrA family NAD(P)-binding protein [Actinocorallia longicatena]|uniref:NAD(P)H-binding protein n=1 Tax=Actinocorallia longicatena TaxID=111803 RepID=A0ABP6QG85_9ACTN